MNLFQLGDFTLSSGVKSAWKLECDALTPEDWEALAQMIRFMVGPFSSVEGIPRGGLQLAEALQPFVGPLGPHLIVDDVLTTGGSMQLRRQNRMCGLPYANFPLDAPNREVVGAVVFARGQLFHWVKALFQLPECFWPERKHR